LSDAIDGLDRSSLLIYRILKTFDKFMWKRDKLCKLYLWNPKLWNSAIVEGTGVLIYLAFSPLFQLWFILTVRNIVWSNILANIFCIPISFLTKFMIYNKWLFKRRLDE